MKPGKTCILILLDGLGDRGYFRWGSSTPLMAASTPNLDKLAAMGANGLYHPTFFGEALPSEMAHFSMFGYPFSGFPGRGALEALGLDIPLGQNDVALLSHFACLETKKNHLYYVSDPDDLESSDASAFYQDIFTENPIKDRAENFQFTLVPASGFRSILVMKSLKPGLAASPCITDSDPVLKNHPVIRPRPWNTHADDPDARATADALYTGLGSAFHQMDSHPVNRKRKAQGKKPVNGILTQRAGRLKKVLPFQKIYGLKPLVLASGLVYKGLACYLGMDFIPVEDTRDPGIDLALRIEQACSQKNTYDFIHVHTKTPDEAAHTKNPETKKKVIESLDKGMGKVMDMLMDPELLVVITADHSTPSSGPLVHSGEPVPLLILGPGIRKDGVCAFNEVSAAQGALGCSRGRELIFQILNLLDRAKLKGLMDTSEDQPFYPGNRDPFILSH